MDEQGILGAVKAERLRLCEFLVSLDEAEWSASSLCAGWAVRDVVAHLTIPTRATVFGVIVGAVKARGDFHRMADWQARDRASTYSPEELVAQLRETAGSPRRMPGSAPMDPLVDIVVHGQDIARALGRSLPVPGMLAVACLDYVVTAAFTGAPARVAGLRLIASDEDWSTGSGEDQVQGRAVDLLLAVLGRPAGLSGLTGSGRELLSSRFAGASARSGDRHR